MNSVPAAPASRLWLLAPLLPALAPVLLLLALGGCQQAIEKPPVAPPDPDLLGPPYFEDVTAASGVDFTYRNGQEAGHYAILESLGGGAALFDFDGDGRLDLFLPGGGYYDGPDKQTIKGHPCRLYRNLGNGRFKDVTKEFMPEPPTFYTHGCAVADFNRDGWPDLLVTGWGRVALYRNDPVDPKDESKGRRLVEVSKQAGLTNTAWTTSAAWADLDGDGYPDLYLCQYVDWSLKNNPGCGGYTPGILRDVCPPKQFVGRPHLLYRNNRDGTFTDVSKAAGLMVEGVKDKDGKQVDMGKGLGVVIADFNRDGRPDIYVANDTVDNFLYMNRGKWHFDEIGLPSGTARDDRGVPNGSMGVDIGDYDRSGLPSIFVTNYENEMHALYRNLGRGEQFLFSTQASGIAALGQSYVGFGTVFTDVNGDGWEDLLIINGHVIRHPLGAGLQQQPVLLRNKGKGRFKDVTPRGGKYFQTKHIGRGLALGDLDNDGRADFVVSHVNEPVMVVRNIAGDGGKRAHWLGIELVGAGYRDLVGTRLVLEVDGQKRTRFVKGGGSYLSAADPRHLFGLGEAQKVQRLTVEWVGGKSQSFDGNALAVDRYWRLAEGDTTPQVWGGRAALTKP